MSIGNSPESSAPDDDNSPGADNSPAEDKSPEDDRPSIGQALQEARIAARLTVDEVSASTRVRVPIVQAIEQDDFSRCGGDVYARGHIRMLAGKVGLDPDPLIARFDAEHGGRPAPTPAAPLFEAERIRPERRRPNWTAAMVAAIVAVIGFVGFTMFSGGDGDTKTKQVAEGSEPDQNGAKPTPTTSGGAKPAESESAIAAVPHDKVTVKLSATDGKSWISAKAYDGKLLYDGILDEGDSKTFQDEKRIDLVLGNAGAIELFVNGKKVTDEFEVGQVERLSYTQGDPEAG
ncbi:RodZ domain-containing protein [Streptomyces sp. NRRL F-5135]|uniref:helix-turn-helix domain-containing protein n=1 Tax=Streptomyces sp. NRRL F-5135 TaxID=1463858 RepID=UPI0004C67554